MLLKVAVTVPPATVVSFHYLLLFGVELEALIQCAAVVLDMLLLLIS